MDVLRSSRVHDEEGEATSVTGIIPMFQSNPLFHPSMALSMNKARCRKGPNMSSLAMLVSYATTVSSDRSHADICAVKHFGLRFCHDVVEQEYIAFRLRHRRMAFLHPLVGIFVSVAIPVAFLQVGPAASQQRGFVFLWCSVANSVVWLLFAVVMSFLTNKCGTFGGSQEQQGTWVARTSEHENDRTTPSEGSQDYSEGGKNMPQLLEMILGDSAAGISRRRNAFYFELCMFLMYAVNGTAFLIFSFRGNVACMELVGCSANFGYDTLAAFIAIGSAIVLPMRSAIFVVATMVELLLRIAMYWFPGSATIVAEPFALTHVFVLISYAGSVALATSSDYWAREEFATYIRSVIETDHIVHVRERTRSMLESQVPTELVGQLDTSAASGGAAQSTSPQSVVCVLRFARFAAWSAVRSPADAVQLLQVMFSSVEKLVRPFSGLLPHFRKFHSFGDELVVATAGAEGCVVPMLTLAVTALAKFVLDVRSRVPSHADCAERWRRGSVFNRSADAVPVLVASLGVGSLTTAVVHMGNLNLAASGAAVDECRRMVSAVKGSRSLRCASVVLPDAMFDALRVELAAIKGAELEEREIVVVAKQIVLHAKSCTEASRRLHPDLSSRELLVGIAKSTGASNCGATACKFVLIVSAQSYETLLLMPRKTNYLILTASNLNSCSEDTNHRLLTSIDPESVSLSAGQDSPQRCELSTSDQPLEISSRKVAVAEAFLPSRATSSVRLERRVSFIPLIYVFSDPLTETAYQQEFVRSDPLRQWTFALSCLAINVTMFTTTFFHAEIPVTFSSTSLVLWQLLALLMCVVIALPIVLQSALVLSSNAATWLSDVLYVAFSAFFLTAVPFARGTHSLMVDNVCVPWIVLFLYLPLLRPLQSNAWRMFAVDMLPQLGNLLVIQFNLIGVCGDVFAQFAIALCILLSFIIRFVWDGRLREQYAAKLELVDVKKGLTSDYQRLQETLESFAPTGVAKQLIHNARKNNNAQIDLSRADKSTDLATGTGDVPFLLFEMAPLGSLASGGGAGAGREASEARAQIDDASAALCAVRRLFLRAAAEYEKLEVVKATSSLVVLCAPREPSTCPTDNDEERSLELASALRDILVGIRGDPAVRCAVEYRAVLSCGQLMGAVAGKGAGASFDLYGGAMSTAAAVVSHLPSGCVAVMPKVHRFISQCVVLRCRCEDGSGSASGGEALADLCVTDSLPCCFAGLPHVTHCHFAHLRGD